jgi:hypothetical protein
MGERLAGGNVAIALLANTLATGAMLVTLIRNAGCRGGRSRDILQRNWPERSQGSRQRI